MIVKVSKEILDKLDSFTVLAYKFSMQVCDTNDEIKAKISELESLYKQKTLEEVINLPRIKEGRDAYKKLGKDPSRYRIACESLLRRLVKDMGLYYINNAVDIGNILSIELNRPTAVLDYDKVIGDVNIRIGTKDDIYEGIGRGIINVENIPLYVDNVSPFGSPTSDTLRTSISLDTKNVLLFVICFKDTYLEESDRITKEIYTKLGKVASFEKINVQYERV